MKLKKHRTPTWVCEHPLILHPEVWDPCVGALGSHALGTMRMTISTHPTPPYPRALTENPTCKSCLFKQAGGLTFKWWDCFCPSCLSRSDLSMCSSWCMLQLNLVVLVQALPPSGCWNISEFIDHPQALSAFGYPLSSLSHSVSSNYADHVNFFFFFKLEIIWSSLCLCKKHSGGHIRPQQSEQEDRRGQRKMSAKLQYMAMPTMTNHRFICRVTFIRNI